MSFRDWFRPPRHVFAIFLVVAFVSAGVLGWLMWLLLEQDKTVELQRRQERLEQAADRAVALRGGTCGVRPIGRRTVAVPIENGKSIGEPKLIKPYVNGRMVQWESRAPAHSTMRSVAPIKTFTSPRSTLKPAGYWMQRSASRSQENLSTRGLMWTPDGRYVVFVKAYGNDPGPE